MQSMIQPLESICKDLNKDNRPFSVLHDYMSMNIICRVMVRGSIYQCSFNPYFLKTAGPIIELLDKFWQTIPPLTTIEKIFYQS